jgi:hypothetical protein
LEDSDEIKAKHTDEIKEFERRLEAAHENLKEDQKLKLNFSKEWVKKMQQLSSKVKKQAERR